MPVVLCSQWRLSSVCWRRPCTSMRDSGMKFTLLLTLLGVIYAWADFSPSSASRRQCSARQIKPSLFRKHLVASVDNTHERAQFCG